MKPCAVRLAGSGGQGLILAGAILAEAGAVFEGYHVVQTDSYGPEARGGASKSDVILDARVVGRLRMIDGGEADDKIVAVLENDSFWGDVTDITELPHALIDRLRHYFGTYKLVPGQEPQFSIEETYDRENALRVVEAAIEDYDDEYGR